MRFMIHFELKISHCQYSKVAVQLIIKAWLFWGHTLVADVTSHFNGGCIFIPDDKKKSNILSYLG